MESYKEITHADSFKAGADWAHNDLMKDVKKLIEALEFYVGTKDSMFEVGDEGRNYYMDNVIYESDLSPEGKCDQPLGTKARQALTEFKKKYPEE